MQDQEFLPRLVVLVRAPEGAFPTINGIIARILRLRSVKTVGFADEKHVMPA